MTESDQPTPDDIEQLIELLEGTPWEVSDWDYSAGMYDTPELFLTAEWDPDAELVTSAEQRESTTRIKEIVESVQDDHEDGVPIGNVIDMAEYELSITSDEAEDTIRNLKRKGELYEPADGKLRAT